MARIINVKRRNGGEKRSQKKKYKLACEDANIKDQRKNFIPNPRFPTLQLTLLGTFAAAHLLVNKTNHQKNVFRSAVKTT